MLQWKQLSFHVEMKLLKPLISVLCKAGTLEAARHAAFLFAEKCVGQVELIEVLDDVGDGRAVAFQSRAALHRHEKQSMRDALVKTGAALDDAGVPYTWKRTFGPPAKTIAAYAAMFIRNPKRLFLKFTRVGDVSVAEAKTPHLSTRQYARIVHRWVASIGLDDAAYCTHTMRRTKASLIDWRTKNLRRFRCC